ncbi:peptidoglycan-binding protein [Paracoccus marcusii]|nr:peptidoglycan-binding protein [Paracoccus marcusii]
MPDPALFGDTPAQTVQRMLLAAGQDPGPDDGVLGVRSRAALRAALGPGSDADVPHAILALLAMRCGG